MSRRRADDPELCGVLLVDKPAGPTSHDVVGWVRWALQVRRVGHCGTLDPDATGLLVVAVGSATKLAPFFTGQDKTYRACIGLGRRTTTADAAGQTLEQRACPPDLEARVPAAVAGLVGAHQLPPPAFSAVHVDGVRAHVLARAGQAPKLDARPMTVHEATDLVVTRHGDEVWVEVTLAVSKGTYVRSLAEALGAALDRPGYLVSLHRVRSGTLSLATPRAVQGLTATPDGTRPDGAPRLRLSPPGPAAASREAAGAWLRGHLLDPADAVPMPVLRVVDDERGQRAIARLGSGQPLRLDDPGLPALTGPAPQVAVAASGAPGLVIASVDEAGSRLQPLRVIVAPAFLPLTGP